MSKLSRQHLALTDNHKIERTNAIYSCDKQTFANIMMTASHQAKEISWQVGYLSTLWTEATSEEEKEVLKKRIERNTVMLEALNDAATLLRHIYNHSQFYMTVLPSVKNTSI